MRLEDKHKAKIGSKGLFNSINEFVDFLNDNCKYNDTDRFCIQVGGKYLKVVSCSEQNVATAVEEVYTVSSKPKVVIFTNQLVGTHHIQKVITL